MASEHYLTEDAIISQIGLPNPCEIRVDISDERVQVIIGPRDFYWKRGCPDLSGAGTTFSDMGIPEDF